MSRESTKVQTFSELAGAFLDDAKTPGELFEAAQQLHALLSDTVGFTGRELDPDLTQETHLAAGKAISPLDAGRCLMDLARTSKFARGLAAAIEDVRARRDGPVRVLYAGCGPFATLMLPQMTRFSPDEVQFRLFDLHDASMASLKTTAETFDLGRYIESVEQTDATTVRIESPERYDILLVECMQTALVKEPQVAITCNLLKQLRDDVILLPGTIELRAVLANMAAELAHPEASPDRMELGPLFTVNTKTVRGWPDDELPATLPGDTVVIPASAAGSRDAFIATTVKIYGDLVLGDRESGITTPLLIDQESQIAEGGRFVAEYHTDRPRVVLKDA